MAHVLTQSLLLGVAAGVAAGCAAVTCRPATIIVVKKDEIVRLDTGPGRMRTTERGRLEEEVTPTLVREYWARSDQGVWYRLSAEQFRTAEVGRAVEICQ